MEMYTIKLKSGECIHKVMLYKCDVALFIAYKRGFIEKPFYFGLKDDKAILMSSIEEIVPLWENVVECCPECGREIELRWDIKEDGYEIYCPYCGVRMMLCDECMHRDENDEPIECDCSCCDYDMENKECFRSRKKGCNDNG